MAFRSSSGKPTRPKTTQEKTPPRYTRLTKKRHQESLARKFKEERELVEKLEAMPEKFKDHTLPLARIKKIMKSDEDVKVASAQHR